MPQQHSVVIFFNADRLESTQRFNPAKRRRLLQDGMEIIREHFPSIRLGDPFVSSLSVPADVPTDSLVDLRDFLIANDLGRPQLDGEYLKAAT